MYHCNHCDSYFNADRLNTLPSGLPVHRYGHVPQRLTNTEASPLLALVDRHDRKALERIYQSY